MATYDFTITSVMSIDNPTMKDYDPNIHFVVTFRNLDCIEYKGSSREFHDYIFTCAGRHYDNANGCYYSLGMAIPPEILRDFEDAIDPQMLKCRLRVTTSRERLGNQWVPTVQYKFSVIETVSSYKKEELKKPTKSFTINRAVEIRKANKGNPNDDKFLIFFERDEDWDWKPKIDIYSEDHNTISAINKKLKKSSSTHRYYLVVEASGNVTEPHCKNGFFAVNGYVKDNKDIAITSYEEVNLREENKMRNNCVTVDDVYNSMTDAQQKICQYMISEALKNAIKSFTPDSIKKVIYNDPATIIFWSDGTKTVVKCIEDEDYDPEKGFMAAVTKKVFGDKYGWVLRHQVKPAMEHEKEVDTLMDSITDALRRKYIADKEDK